MFQHTNKLRVRYGETDQMGYVYYGNYAEYFEVGRVEALRSLGFNYKILEEQGVLLPVVRFEIDYKKPAYYDDLLSIETSIIKMPGVKIEFAYTCCNEAGDLLNVAKTTLVFLNKATGKPMQCPQAMIDALAPFFSLDA